MSADHTPGPWFVRFRRDADGAVLDCFVAAPPTNGMPYDAEILGDDEYREDTGTARKVADAHVVAAALELRAALEEARNGLLWYRDRNPDQSDGSDDETMRRIDAALAKSNGSDPERVFHRLVEVMGLDNGVRFLPTAAQVAAGAAAVARMESCGFTFPDPNTHSATYVPGDPYWEIAAGEDTKVAATYGSLPDFEALSAALEDIFNNSEIKP